MKSMVWTALLAGGLLFGSSMGASALTAGTGSAVQSALAEVTLVQDVRYRRCHCVRWKCHPKPPRYYCPPRKPYKSKPKY